MVFGDIGTSPLYAFQIAINATGHTPPTPTDVRGIVSLIFWALTLLVSVKYVQLVLRADNDGEGGILALLALVEGDRLAAAVRISFPMVLGMLGASLLYGDGVITPAISVLSAMEGLKLAAPGFQSFILPVTLGILVGLFAIQSQGTDRIGRLFGPIMVVWFLVIGLLGAINITASPGIVTALNPMAAVPILTESPQIAAAVFGAIFLALTGGEALYADMGHVGAPAIRLAWFGLVIPALALNYLGQGALTIADPTTADASPFYKLAPAWALVPLIVLAAGGGDDHCVAGADLRCVFADPAGDADGVVSARRHHPHLDRGVRTNLCADRQLDADGRHAADRSYLQDLGQSRFGLWRRGLRDDAGDDDFTRLPGQAALALAAGGGRSHDRRIWYRGQCVPWRQFAEDRRGRVVSADRPGGAIAFLMWCWRRGTVEVRGRLHKMSMPLPDFIEHIDEKVIGRPAGTAVWLTKVEHGISPMILHHVQHNAVLHRTVVLLTVVPDRRPRVPFRERHSIERLGHGFHHITVRLGFMQLTGHPVDFEELPSCSALTMPIWTMCITTTSVTRP